MLQNAGLEVVISKLFWVLFPAPLNERAGLKEERKGWMDMEGRNGR
jgi:hypothetical protein